LKILLLSVVVATTGVAALAGSVQLQGTSERDSESVHIVAGTSLEDVPRPAMKLAPTNITSATQERSVPAAAMAANGTWWKPTQTDTWQWQLNGTISTKYNVNIYDIDLFDASDATITALHSRGVKVICYFSAGSYENWRDKAYNGFAETDRGKSLDGWEGERWLDIRSANVQKVMNLRLDLAKERKCDGVEPDNVDGYKNKTGFPLTGADQLTFNRFLATEAHRRGLAVGLKNDVDQVKDLVDSFDFSVNEQCHEYIDGDYDECSSMTPFIASGKPVLNAEYAARFRNNTGKARDKLCSDAKSRKFRTLVLPLDLNDTYRFSCDPA
jgi:hypothetical protein